MVSSIDLIVLLLVRAGGLDQQHLPGLHWATPPRRLARGRERDQVIFYLTQMGNAPLAGEQINELLTKMVVLYYSLPGSVTSCLHSTADWLNQFFVERNLSTSNLGQQIVGILTQIIFRRGQVFLAQSGPRYTLFITAQGAEQLLLAQTAGRGLGLSRTAPLGYSLLEFQPNDALLLSPQPPPAWTPEALKDAHNLGLESLRRRLLSQSSTELRALLIKAQTGTGKLLFQSQALTPSPRALRQAIEPTPTRPASSSEKEQVITEHITSAVEPAVIRLPQEPTTRAPQITRVPTSISRPEESFPRRRSRPTEAISKATKEVDYPASPSLGKLVSQAVISGFRQFGLAFWKTFVYLGKWVGKLLRRMLPDEGLFNLPAPTMAMVAILVPVIVVAIAGISYIKQGRDAYYQTYYTQALTAAELAGSRTEPRDIRIAWSAALELLNQAEQFGQTMESRALRVKAQEIIDRMDYIERLDFKPALLNPLDPGTQLTQMVATEADLYLLDARSGVVLRATRTSSGYSLDPTFECGPGIYSEILIGALIDITPLPKNNRQQAVLLAMDSGSNLLFCKLDDPPSAATLTLPNTNVGLPIGLTVDNGDLYLLDPQNNAVWIYRGLDVSRTPRLFFDEQVPPMEDVIDIAVNRNDLYLLHSDGHLTLCTYSSLVESPTRCDETASFTDPRPGRQSGAIIEEALFTRILFASPPDPSIYLLDAGSQAAYHFSVRLNLQRQFQSRTSLSKTPVTAFAISHVSRVILLAFGDQLYQATLP